MIKVRYNALDNYEEASHQLRSLPFDGIVSPVDGVKYPCISPIPASIGESIHTVLSAWYPERRVDIQFQFARLSLEGLIAPHRVHNDLSMGDYTSILYICEQGGTSLHTHRELGFSGQPTSEVELEAWKRDHSVVEAWHTDLYIPAEGNKITSYPADRLHSASPGYGRDHNDGRLVVVTFFNLT